MYNHFLFILVSCIILLFVGILCIRYFLIVITVQLQSMSPTLEHGDRVLILRHWPAMWLRKEQIVLLQSEFTPKANLVSFRNIPYIKRITGLGGEAVKDVVEMDHILQQKLSFQHDQQAWHIPPGHIFVRGDNYLVSIDSRHWGPLPVESVLGVVIMKLPYKASPPYTVPFSVEPTDGIGLQVGQDAPPFTAQQLSGETVSLTTYSGCEAIFLFIEPSNLCRQTLLTYLPRAVKAGVKLILVSALESKRTRPFVDELGSSFPVLIAPSVSNPFLHDYKVVGMPFYCCISKQGKIQSTGFPNEHWKEWKALTDLWSK